jgi:hypothetical protein
MSRRSDLLLTFDFPPMGGGIARMMAEIALQTAGGELVVSTGELPGGAASESRAGVWSQRLPAQESIDALC